MVRIFLVSCALFFVLGVTLALAAGHIDLRQLATFSLFAEMLPLLLLVLLVLVAFGGFLFRRKRHEQRA